MKSSMKSKQTLSKSTQTQDTHTHDSATKGIFAWEVFNEIRIESLPGKF